MPRHVLPSRTLAGLAAVSTFVLLLPIQSSGASGSSSGSSAGAAVNTELCIHAKPRSGETETTAITNLEKKIGRKYAVHAQYYKWGTNFAAKSSAQVADDQAGRTPLVHWRARRPNGQDVSWKSIAAGREDSVIKAMASSIKSYGKPMYLDFHHEPENDTGSDGYGSNGTRTDYIAAFRRIHQVFKSVGVPNVKWLQTLMAMTVNQGNANAWYVGSAYVDYLSFNGFNWYPAKGKWRTISDIYSAAYKWSVSMRKPMMITETGAQEDPKMPGRKGKWMLEALATLKTWPNLKVFCYYHSPTRYPWWIDSSLSSLSAYKTLATDPWMLA